VVIKVLGCRGERRSWGSWGSGGAEGAEGAEERRKKRELIIWGYKAQEIPLKISPHPV